MMEKSDTSQILNDTYQEELKMNLNIKKQHEITEFGVLYYCSYPSQSSQNI